MTEVDGTRQWRAAASDAGVAEVDVFLHQVAPGEDGYRAMHFPPGVSPPPTDRAFAYSDDDHQTIVRNEDRHVVVYDESLDGRRRVLTFRHEAEHVGQYVAHPPTSEVALRTTLGSPTEWLYAVMPHERDANAASTGFALELGIVATSSDLEGPDRFLFAAPWTRPDRTSLPIRLLAFSLLFPDEFDAACRDDPDWPPVDPDATLEALVPGAHAARRVHRDLLAGAIDTIADHGVSREDWDTMSSADRNRVRDSLRLKILEQEQRATELLAEYLAQQR